MADELRCIVVSGLQPAAILRLSSPAVANPVFAVSDEDDGEGGGTIGTNIIGPKFDAYLEQLSVDDPITLEVRRVSEGDVAEAQQLAAEQARHVVLIERGD